MYSLKKILASAAAGLTLLTVFLSCEEDLTTIGDGVIGGQPFVTDKITFDVFAYNKKVNAVRTNKLPVYQLGTYNDPIYGKTEAQITSQIQLSQVNPAFGSFSQDTEDNPNSSVATQIQENETVEKVMLYIPYLSRDVGFRDRDRDGVDNEFDADPDDPNSDSDGDGLTDNQERLGGTNPLNSDTDADGIDDPDDDNNSVVSFPRRIELDSIYGDVNNPFTLKVARSTFFLRDLNPNANFLEAQEYFSNQEFAPTFVTEELFNGPVLVDNQEILTFEEDDPETEADESNTLDTRRDPGIFVELDNLAFFQENILNKEGQSELLSAANFKEFLRGLHLSISDVDSEFLMLTDLTQANITITYSYDRVNTNGTADDISDDTIEKAERDFRLDFLTGGGRDQFGGLLPITNNAVNTFINEDYPAEITANLDTEQNAERIYLKGGAGSIAEIKLFDENNGEEIINQIKANNWIINEANLVFYVDRAALDAAPGAIEPPRLYLYNAETNAPLYNIRFDQGNEENSLLSFPDYDGVLESSGDRGIKYTVRITSHINDIIVRDVENATLGLALTSNINIAAAGNAMFQSGEQDLPLMSVVNPFGTILFGSNVTAAEANNKLALEIFYTQTN